MNRLLITGASGFIGSHFHEQVDQSRIVNLDLEPPTFPFNSTYVAGDIREPNSVDAALANNPCDAVICLAAEHKDFGIEKHSYFRTNEYGTHVTCDVAAKHGIKRIMFFSSVAVYGDVSKPTTEATPPNPANHYGASKLAGEAVLRRWVEEDPSRSVVIMRPTVVFGARNLANMLRLIIQIDEGYYANIGKADNVKSIAYVENVVAAAMFLLEMMQPGIEVFNYVDQPQLSVRQITETIADAMGKPRPLTVPYPLAIALGLPFDLAIKLTGRDLPVSTTRIKKLCTATHNTAEKLLNIGFEPRFSNLQGLRKMVEWYRAEKVAGHRPTVATSSAG
jgi:nucleoside-diphosphate-sugar epimerase